MLEMAVARKYKTLYYSEWIPNWQSMYDRANVRVRFFHIDHDCVLYHRCLSLKASLQVPEMLEHLAKFHAMTAFWLVQVNLHVVDEKEDNFAPKHYKPVTFPLPEVVPITLRCVKKYAYCYLKDESFQIIKLRQYMKCVFTQMHTWVCSRKYHRIFIFVTSREFKHIRGRRSEFFEPDLNRGESKQKNNEYLYTFIMESITVTCRYL